MEDTAISIKENKKEHEILKEFTNMYKQMPELWDISRTDYSKHNEHQIHWLSTLVSSVLFSPPFLVITPKLLRYKPFLLILFVFNRTFAQNRSCTFFFED